MSIWIVREAEKLQDNIHNGVLNFATGYGPSGLPHIGTFAEVQRTVMVMKAFKEMNPSIKSVLYVFSDDMDALRKVPNNVPQQKMLENYIGVSLTSIPDPFGTSESYGLHMNKRLKGFLDKFGFEYDFKSATECYKSGVYNVALRKILDKYDEVVNLVLPYIGAERSKTYSPFLPISQKTQKVLQVPIHKIDKVKGVVYYYDEITGEEVGASVTDGGCKLQWRADWGMRWDVFNIGYEMYGKDLDSSAKIAAKICNVINQKPPLFFRYELFLDEKGGKISKSKGNGLSIEEWLNYAPIESLKFYLSNDPSRARKLYFDAIPKSVDDYLHNASVYNENMSVANCVNNPIWYINNSRLIISKSITYSMLLNLVSASGADNRDVLWGFIKNYDNTLSLDNKFFNDLVDFAIKYYHDFIKPKKNYYKPSIEECSALLSMANDLLILEKENKENIDAKILQNTVLLTSKKHGYNDTGDWFLLIYKTLFGQNYGPRIGSFIKIYGINNFVALIHEACKD
ncbi:lysine--tRNA ligase [Candidatus Xenohaliotis californiensis]